MKTDFLSLSIFHIKCFKRVMEFPSVELTCLVRDVLRPVSITLTGHTLLQKCGHTPCVGRQKIWYPASLVHCPAFWYSPQWPWDMLFGQLEHKLPHLLFVHNGKLCPLKTAGSQRQQVKVLSTPELTQLPWVGGSKATFWRAYILSQNLHGHVQDCHSASVGIWGKNCIRKILI